MFTKFFCLIILKQRKHTKSHLKIHFIIRRSEKKKTDWRIISGMVALTQKKLWVDCALRSFALIYKGNHPNSESEKPAA